MRPFPSGACGSRRMDDGAVWPLVSNGGLMQRTCRALQSGADGWDCGCA